MLLEFYTAPRRAVTHQRIVALNAVRLKVWSNKAGRCCFLHLKSLITWPEHTCCTNSLAAEEAPHLNVQQRDKLLVHNYLLFIPVCQQSFCHSGSNGTAGVLLFSVTAQFLCRMQPLLMFRATVDDNSTLSPSKSISF